MSWSQPSHGLFLAALRAGVRKVVDHHVFRRMRLEGYRKANVRADVAINIIGPGEGLEPRVDDRRPYETLIEAALVLIMEGDVEKGPGRWGRFVEGLREVFIGDGT